MTQKIILYFLCWLAGLPVVPAQQKPVISADFPGGNIVLERMDNDTLYLRPDLRDTEGEWFYWYFAVREAAGRKLFFQFTQPNALAAFGPAVSMDGGKSWAWLYNQPTAGDGFSYTFPAKSGEIRFSVGMPYTQANLETFLARHRKSTALQTGTLTVTPEGRKVEKITIREPDSNPKHKVLITARHHACEMMASYVLEGIVEALLSDDRDMARLRQNAEFLLIPFVDKDGVERGDQGKNRRPRDHNRDYSGESLYATTAALREQVPPWAEGKLRVGLDLHCPYIKGEEHEKIFLVGLPEGPLEREQRQFAGMLESSARGALAFNRNVNYLPYGTSWNKATNSAKGMNFNQWAASLDGVSLSVGLEFPYAVNGSQVVTADKARQFGQDLAHALALYLETGDGRR